jgi:hypothetical protein
VIAASSASKFFFAALPAQPISFLCRFAVSLPQPQTCTGMYAVCPPQEQSALHGRPFPASATAPCCYAKSRQMKGIICA